MQGMRQSIAMSICLFAYMFAEKRKLMPFLILVAMATLIHKTAILFCIVYPLPHVKLKPIYIFLVIIAIATAMYSSQHIINFANDLWEKEYNDRVLSGGYIASAIYVLICAFCLFASKYPLEDNVDNMMFYVLVIGFISYLGRYIGTRAAERVSFYFTFSQLILLPNTLKNGRIGEKDKVAVEMAILFLCILLFMYRLHDSNFIPFKFYWGDI
jgi:hypothetical protein